MALNIYLTLTGIKSGIVKGGVLQKGREGQIAVCAVEQQVSVPRDPASGMASGFRRHTPLVITKEIDQSSPVLHTMISTNESIKELTLGFYDAQTKPAIGVGKETLIYTIKLKDAVITRISTIMENNRTEPGRSLPVLEEIEFAFGLIEWTWVDGNITSVDSVRNP